MLKRLVACLSLLGVVFLANMAIEAPERQITPQNSVPQTDLLVRGNSLVGISYLPGFMKIDVRASLINEIDWTDPSEDEALSLIWEKYSSMASLLMDLGLCESGWKHNNKYGDNWKSYGFFQFQQPTFDRFCSGKRENFNNQLDCAFSMITSGIGPKHWVNCYIKMNLYKYK